jgi:hypothetical protein
VKDRRTTGTEFSNSFLVCISIMKSVEVNNFVALMGCRNNNSSDKDDDQDQVGIMISNHQKTRAEE